MKRTLCAFAVPLAAFLFAACVTSGGRPAPEPDYTAAPDAGPDDTGPDDAAPRINPDDAVALFNRGNEYRRKGDVDKAIADYTAVLHINP
ncbi:MAG: tetratricopeptide repeat protein, partial [Treponema sp.]|nr:tetratricopeptide repeat protein [Treponema sp.]